METVLFFNTYYLCSLACSFNHRKPYEYDVRCDSVSVSTQMLNVFQTNIIMTNVSHIMILFSAVACSTSAFYFAIRLHKKPPTTIHSKSDSGSKKKKRVLDCWTMFFEPKTCSNAHTHAHNLYKMFDWNMWSVNFIDPSL